MKRSRSTGSCSWCGSWLIFLFLFAVVSFGLYAQSDDSEVARKYIDWINKTIQEGNLQEARAALVRAADFADVSSDISYELAVIQSKLKTNRILIIDNLTRAIDTNRWVKYNENNALIFKAEQLIAMRLYYHALDMLDYIGEEVPADAKMTADATMLRLLALKNLAIGIAPAFDLMLLENESVIIYPVYQPLMQFRSLVLTAMDRYPRDSRPLRIFFEFIKYRNPVSSDLPQADLNLLELALKRLPFLLEADPDLAWMAAPFIYDLEYARRLVGAYRAASPQPKKDSIPIALNLGLIDDDTAIEESFSMNAPDEIKTLDKEILIDTYSLLRSEEGRELFTQRIFSFTGLIESDEDHDGIKDNFIYYKDGMLKDFKYYETQNNSHDFYAAFEQNIPVFCNYNINGSFMTVTWERYPSVEKIEFSLSDSENEIFNFGPAVMQYRPVNFDEIGGSNKIFAFSVPVIEHQYLELSRHALFSFCSSYSHPSLEIEAAVEIVYLNRGVILQVVETLNEKQISVTEFDRGLPVIQHIDLDLDGRMETIRRFRKPPRDYVWQDLLDYRRLVASSESDWSGDGKYKTREVYQLDGSVVYSFDMDGSGEINHTETGNEQ